MSRALFCFLISLLAPPKRPLQFITSDVGSFSSYSCGAGVEALFFSLHFLPTHLYKGKKKVICSPLPCSCPMKEAVDLERYALEGNAVWITIWHVWFLTYFFFFFFCTWPCGFPAHIFQSVFDRKIWGNYQRTAFFVLLLQHGQCCWCSWGQEKSWQMWNFSLIKASKYKERKEILTFGSVLLTNTCSDSWPVPEFFNGFIIHSCWLQWNLG